MDNGSFYLSCSYGNKDKAHEIITFLEERGYKCSCDWTQLELSDEPNPWWMMAVAEAQGVANADLYIGMPGRSKTHVELGIALAACKEIVLIGTDEEWQDMTGVDNPCPFWHHPRARRFKDLEAFMFSIGIAR